MKAFIKQSLEMMGARVSESADNTLHAETPRGTRSEALLGGGHRHLLAFSTESTGDAQQIVPGCQLLDNLKFELSRIGSVRHGIYPGKINFSRKDVKAQYTLFSGNLVKLSVRSSWTVMARCHVKILLTGNEFFEDIIAIDVSPGETPRLVEKISELPSELNWVEKPPIKRYQLQELIEKGLGFAEKMAVEKAEDLQAEHLKHLYTTMTRLRSYYRQLKDERTKKGDQDAAETYEAEYQYRKTEEMQHARAHARVKIIALETYSFPTKKIRFQIEHNGQAREVSTSINLFSGNIVAPVRCDICNCQTVSFGMTDSGAIACSDCHTHCEICDVEITGKHVKPKHACSTCGRHVCPDHSLSCDVCKELVCLDHICQCNEGCHICKNCLRSCPDCGDTILWCKDHTVVNSNGDAACRSHAVYCIECQEYHPAQKTDTCSTCGRTICLNCRKSCTDCNQIFCFNHIKKGKCAECHSEMEKRQIQTQMKLFRQGLAHRLKVRKS
jgi:hypothetical protein